MDCRESQGLLHGYIDLELEPRAAIDLEGHLVNCPACAREHRSHEALRAGLRSAKLTYRAPAALKAKLAASAFSQEKPSTFFWFDWRPLSLAVGFAAVAFVLGLNTPRWRAGFGENRSIEEVVDSHVRALKSGHLTDVASTDQHTVKPWFAGKLDYAPPVVDMAENGFPLVGGRLDVLTGKPVAALDYKRREHVIDLYVWPAEAGTANPPRPRTFRGFHLTRWVQADMVHLAVSDLSAEDLARFADLLRTQPAP